MLLSETASISVDTVLRVVYAESMTWQIRNVPDKVHSVLRHEALDRKTSVNALVIEILSKAAEKIEAVKAKGGSK
jgi:hypothetical protein